MLVEDVKYSVFCNRYSVDNPQRTPIKDAMVVICMTGLQNEAMVPCRAVERSLIYQNYGEWMTCQNRLKTLTLRN